LEAGKRGKKKKGATLFLLTPHREKEREGRGEGRWGHYFPRWKGKKKTTSPRDGNPCETYPKCRGGWGGQKCGLP